jgi:CheY-like chemotaxis protein
MMAQALRKQVLVVEDHPLIRIVACDALAAHGITALEAGNADEALEALARHPLIALVFTDVHPTRRKKDFHFVRNLRIVRPDVEVIVTSGAVTDPDSELPEDAAFLLKPYPVNMLVEIIEEKLGRQGNV